MKLNNVNYFKLSYLKYHLDDEIKTLPHLNGIYYWVYWPKFNEASISKNDLIQLVTDFTNKKLVYSESFDGKYKFKGEISEQWFRNNGNLFGLPNAKNKKLIQHLNNRQNIKEFAVLFKELCFARPFYIGKANNLKTRLKQHFNRSNSTILDQIDEIGILHSEIWVGYRLIKDPKKTGLNNIFEEIFNRTFKPGLTKQPY